MRSDFFSCASDPPGNNKETTSRRTRATIIYSRSNHIFPFKFLVQRCNVSGVGSGFCVLSFGLGERTLNLQHGTLNRPALRPHGTILTIDAPIPSNDVTPSAARLSRRG